MAGLPNVKKGLPVRSSYRVVTGPPEPTKIPSVAGDVVDARNATVPKSLMETGASIATNAPLPVSAIVTIGPPLPANPPAPPAFTPEGKATVPTSLIATPSEPKPKVVLVSAMVVIDRPVPVKMPTPPSFKLAKKATLPPLLSETEEPNPPKTLLVSA